MWQNMLVLEAFDGVAAQYPNCTSCHGAMPKFQDIFTRWQNSGHATRFKGGIDGQPAYYHINPWS